MLSFMLNPSLNYALLHLLQLISRSRALLLKIPMSDQLYLQLFGSPIGKVTGDAPIQTLFERADIELDEEITPVRNGLYYLYNRHDSAGRPDDEKLYDYSLNYTFAVYDRESKRLYYYEMDT